MSAVRERLEEKLQQNLKDFIDDWVDSDHEKLILNADSIAATSQAYKLLMKHEFNDVETEYLLKFENPLELVRDRWAFNTIDHDSRMNIILEHMAENNVGENIYTLDPTYDADVDMEFEM